MATVRVGISGWTYPNWRGVFYLGAERDGPLYVPGGYSPERPAPLALLLHGAGAEARQALGYLLAVPTPPTF